MLKILLFADTHLGYDYPIRPRVKKRRRGKDFFKNYKKALDYALTNQIDLVLHGGDFFFRSKVPSSIIDKAYRVLYEFARKGIPTVIVPGNHERAILPASLMTYHKNIFVLDEPKTYFFNIKANSIAISGFPFVRNNIRDNFTNVFQQSIAGNPETDVKILLMHQSIQYSSIKNYTFYTGQDVIPQKLLPLNFDAILAGHIHRAQIMWLNTDKQEIPIIYPGSTARTSITEKDEEKGFFVLSFDEKYPNNLIDIDFQVLPTRPMAVIEIPRSMGKNALAAWLKTRIKWLDNNAVIRLQCNIKSMRKYLTAKFLRKITPPDITLTLAPYYSKKKKKLKY